MFKIRRRNSVLFIGLFIAISMNTFAQRTIFGIVSDSIGNKVEEATVSGRNSAMSVMTNHLGEYEINVSDSCHVLVFQFEDVQYFEQVNDRYIVNVSLPIALSPKQRLSMNPRKDYPWGLQLTLAGHSLFAVSLNYFASDRQSFEIGACGRGIEVGTRRYFPLNDVGNNLALYTGIICNVPLDTDFVVYVPFGFHILSHNGMAFGVELAGKSPLYLREDKRLINFLGFGINFGFQF